MLHDEELERKFIGVVALAGHNKIQFRSAGDQITIVASNGRSKQITKLIFYKLTPEEILALVGVKPSERTKANRVQWT